MSDKERDNSHIETGVIFTAAESGEKAREAAAEVMAERADELSEILQEDVKGAMLDWETGEIIGRVWSGPNAKAASRKAKQFSFNYRPGQHKLIFTKEGKA